MNSRCMFENLDALLLIMATSNSPFSTATIYVAALASQRVTKEFCQMRRAFLHLAMAFALAFGSATAYAQMGQGGEYGHRQPMSADQRLQMMTKQLNLTTDQQQQIKPILENEQEQVQALHQDSSLSPQDRMSKMQQIRENAAGQIKPILNADQQAKYQQMMSHQGHRGGWGQGPGEQPQNQSNPQ